MGRDDIRVGAGWELKGNTIYYIVPSNGTYQTYEFVSMVYSGDEWAGVALRCGWEESLNGAYTFTVDGRICGYIRRGYDGSGWVGRVYTIGTTNPSERGMATAEEAMIWVETTYALTRK
jgi:hypothetical protein